MALLKSLSLFALAVTLTVPAFAAPAETADTLFAHAQAEAQKEHKNVLLVFSASWCGPCKLYERFLEDPQMKPITEKAFVVARIDVGESASDPRHADTPGGVALRTALGAQPEPGFYFAGMRSYGRAPTFLMVTGYEQVRSIVADIAGDKAAAERVELVLPETGVCSRPVTGTKEEAGCCGGPALADKTACCKADETAKGQGKAGCGCS